MLIYTAFFKDYVILTVEFGRTGEDYLLQDNEIQMFC